MRSGGGGGCEERLQEHVSDLRGGQGECGGGGVRRDYRNMCLN